MSWAVFLTAPGLPGHHLLSSRERLVLGREPGVRERAVRLVPGVRVDNLEELFAPYEERPPAERWPLRLKRRPAPDR